MQRYIIKRLILLFPILLGVSIFVFFMLRLVPGDPAQAILGEHASPQALLLLRAKLGLNQPLYLQFLHFLANLVRLNFGQSIQTNNPAFYEVLSRFPATVELTLASMAIAVTLGLFLGIFAASNANRWVDYLASSFSLLGLSIPIFWLGLLFILGFAVHLNWFPFSGRSFVGTFFQTPTRFYLLDSLISGKFENVRDVLSHIFLPALALSTIPLAMIAKTTRSSLLEVLQQEYIQTALAKGVHPRNVLWRHALKNAAIPILTVTGFQFGSLLGGAALTETVFNWPGVGKLVVEAVRARDYPVIQASVLLIATTFVILNTLVDLFYSWFDPRVRQE